MGILLVIVESSKEQAAGFYTGPGRAANRRKNGGVAPGASFIYAGPPAAVRFGEKLVSIPLCGERRDAVGNGSDYVPATPLTVGCSSAADPESTLSWSDKTTLTWNAIAGATRYNVYRGDLASLATLYGLCQNSRDPNLTDLQFLETQDPSPAGQAFNFLVSYASGGVEKGLGKRSSGAPRTVSSPCP
jgi:hypothetical protein